MSNKAPSLTEKQQIFRSNVMQTLRLISSADEQRTYQRNVPIADVPAELFCQWEECFQISREMDWFRGAFGDCEF
jgi:hypothetical protein